MISVFPKVFFQKLLSFQIFSGESNLFQLNEYLRTKVLGTSRAQINVNILNCETKRSERPLKTRRRPKTICILLCNNHVPVLEQKS